MRKGKGKVNINLSQFVRLQVRQTHKEILSPKEREMIERFLNNEKNSESFYVLKYRIKKYHSQLNQDFNLIEKSFKKFQET